MTFKSEDYAILVLSDGTFLEGKAFGFKETVYGELVFNTGITGYQEVITDPSYKGQLVTFTYPELGNTGVNSFDKEADKPYVKGVIARQITHKPSNWRSKESIGNWLENSKVVGIHDLDTRALVRHLRESGSMNAAICTNGRYSPIELLEKLRECPPMAGLDLASEVTTKQSYKWTVTTEVSFDKRIKSSSKKPFKVVAIDFGIKRSILNRLAAHGCEVEILPLTVEFSEILNLSPDVVFLSNGPGDPENVKEAVQTVKELLGQIPMFGICLGHQIIGLALGGKTFKLAYGHRGLNHPCGKTGQIEITSQNHGFALDSSSLNPEIVEITHFNLNDKTVAGIAMLNRSVFGVQYHPEASPGPHDADHHFARFVELMSERRLKIV